jgi:acetyl esterase/lipase
VNVQMQAVLDQWTALHPQPAESLTPAEARKQPTLTDAANELIKKNGKNPAPEQVGGVRDQRIPVRGASIPVRMYQPPQGTPPFPILVYYHSGGWVLGGLDEADAPARALAKAANVMVVSVGYRLAPEHKFPTAHADAFNAYKWVLAHAKAVGGDASRVAVGGESAGGNLAAAVAMMARDSGVKVPAYQVLVYPIAGHDLEAPSYRENGTAKPLDRATMEWFFSQYLKSPNDASNPLIDLVHAPDFKGLPPATVITAEIDPLRSEGEALANKLKGAGVDVDYRNYRGVTHGFFGLGAVVTSARDAEQQAADALMKALGIQPPAAAPSQGRASR